MSLDDSFDAPFSLFPPHLLPVYNFIFTFPPHKPLFSFSLPSLHSSKIIKACLSRLQILTMPSKNEPLEEEENSKKCWSGVICLTHFFFLLELTRLSFPPSSIYCHFWDFIYCYIAHFPSEKSAMVKIKMRGSEYTLQHLWKYLHTNFSMSKSKSLRGYKMKRC